MTQQEKDTIEAMDKSIKNRLYEDYGIVLNSRWRNKTYFYFGKSIPQATSMTTIETIEYLNGNIEQLVYFIHGMRAVYNVEKMPWLNKNKG
tara:strand:- start:1008 stop:1280 length:273 start_codon:yes stop_codon:yes gene_type:complete